MLGCYQMTLAELDERLAAATAEWREASSGPVNVERARQAAERMRAAQRAFYGAKGEEYAVPVKFDVSISPSGSEPVLLQTELRTVLLFLFFAGAKQRRRLARRRRGNVVQSARFAVVEIVGCSQTKFGYPNDEALPGHPLYWRGMAGYEINEVKNSTWVKQIVEMNRVQFPATPDSTQRHFIFSFHDSTLECIATRLRLEKIERSYKKALRRAVDLAFEH